MTIAVRGFRHEEVAAGAFKTNCLAVVDEVQTKHEIVVITRRGKAVAKLVPVDTGTDESTISWLARVSLPGTSFRPAISPEDWGELK